MNDQSTNLETAQLARTSRQLEVIKVAHATAAGSCGSSFAERLIQGVFTSTQGVMAPTRGNAT